MNSEFQRNVWLELTPLRLIVLCALLALAFFAAALTDGFAGTGTVARWLFVIVVVIWGTHNAARSVVGEIQGRTWDSQRLSSLGAGTMMWGKLFGSTVFNWVGGAIFLVVIVAETADRAGIVAALYEFAFCIAMGVIAQAASLLASLIAARRRQGRTQFEVFLYQIVGIVAAVAVMEIADPNGPPVVLFSRADTLLWWGQSVPAPAFLLGSLAVFTAWILTGCYRQMRLELKLSNGPYVWLGFLVFATGYAAGFGAGGPFDEVTRRLIYAAATAAGLAYAMAILEPKARVQLRWLGGELGKLHLGTVLTHLQAWMMSYIAAVLLAVALLVHLGLQGLGAEQAATGAALGFVTRDMGLIVLLNMLVWRRGGDLMAIAVLILLYALLPAIIAGLHYGTGQALFLVRQTDPLWFSPAAAWLEAIAVWVVAITTLSLPEESKT